MGYALVPFVTTTYRGRACRRPIGFDASAQNFITIGRGDAAMAVVWNDTDVSDARVSKLSDDKGERLGPSARAVLKARIKDRDLDAAGLQFDQVVAGLLLSPPEGWHAPVRPCSDHRKGYRIWLGPGGRGKNLFFHQPTQPEKHSKAWADTFTRSNGDLDGDTLSGGGTTWVSPSGLINVVSNQAVVTGLAAFDSPTALTNTDADTDNLYAQADYVLSVSGGDDISADIKVNHDSGASSGYFGSIYSYDEASLFSVGPFTFLDGVSGGLTTSGVIKITYDGSALELWLGGVSIVGPVTDTTQVYGSGYRRVGFGAFSETGSGTESTTVDNFLGGDITEAVRWFPFCRF